MSAKSKQVYRVVEAPAPEDPDWNIRSIQGKSDYYTPPATRWPVLISILCFILACIALLQVAISKGISDPNSNGLPDSPKSMPKLLIRANVSSIAGTSTTIPGAYLTTSSVTTSSVLPQSAHFTVSSAFLSINAQGSATTSSGSTSTIVATTAPAEAYLTISSQPVGTISTSSKNSPTVTYAASTSAYLIISSQPPGSISTPSKSSPTVTYAAPPGSYLTISSQSPGSISTPSKSSSIIPVPTVTATGAYLAISSQPGGSISKSSTSSQIPAYITPTGGYLTMSSQPTGFTTGTYLITVGQQGTKDGAYLTKSSYSSGAVPIALSTNSGSSVYTPQTTTLSESVATVAYSAYPGSYMTSSTSYPAPTPSGLKQTELAVSAQFTEYSYFFATYLGTIVAVLLKSTWGLVYAQAKMIEPFYQLAQQGGASSVASLSSGYFASGMTLHSIASLITKRPVMLLVTMIYIAMSVIPPLASEAMAVKPTQQCPRADGGFQPCNPVWILVVPITRALQSVLSLIFVMIMGYLLWNRRRASGVFSDPSSIASVASLLGNEQVRADFRQLDPSASSDEVRKALKPNRYAISNYETVGGQYRYGIVKLSGQNIPSLPKKFSSKTPSPKRGQVIEDILLMIATIGLFGVVLGYYFDAQDDPFNRFFNSNTFGPRFILTVAASILDGQWKRLEREVRIMQPFRRLARGLSKPDRTLLAPMSLSPITTFFTAIWHGNLFLGLIALVAILSDILIIAISGVPYSDAQLYVGFLVSAYLTIGILGLMILTNVGILIWRIRNPPIPRHPETLANIATYLCASRVVDDFASLATLSRRQRDRSIKLGARGYWFGRGIGIDNQVRWMIDDDSGDNTMKSEVYSINSFD